MVSWNCKFYHEQAPVIVSFMPFIGFTASMAHSTSNKKTYENIIDERPFPSLKLKSILFIYVNKN